ncbi:transcription elongation factor B polypeptide 3 [Carica papaya]|uniref:transcription elongation factor B polypeptide 3 n=1 Tax=Carica papaya TaxID=3649 RepID=UPI000B8CF7FA|nr:transcription elongation factor B polypeptide 3 [Carica papaya]XP_021898464.1 transcription elongation factor B polypeptide 3 [Carica papaya]
MKLEYERISGLDKQVPSLIDLCIRTAIDNVRYLGDVGETDLHLLEHILPHCTIDQLMHVEKSSKGRDLSPVTDKLWKIFYEKQFGAKSVNLVIERMKQKKVAFRWKQLYEAKLKDVHEAENKAVDRLKQLYKKEDARKQSRQIQLCTKVPPGSKRSFFGGSGPGFNISNTKSNLMKKAKIDLLKSQEMKNIAAMKKNAVQKGYSAASAVRPGGFAGKNSASTSKHTRPLERR